MTTEHSKALVERFFHEVWSKKNIAIGDDLLADNVIMHNFGVITEGLDAWKQLVNEYQAGFPDIEVVVEFTVAEEDKVAIRWAAIGTHSGSFKGIALTGKRVSIAGVAIYRVLGSKIVEMWSQSDTFGLMKQLGVIPEG